MATEGTMDEWMENEIKPHEAISEVDTISKESSKKKGPMPKLKPKKIKSFLQASIGESESPNIALIRAVKKESEEDARDALANGADVHFENDSALFLASSQGARKMVKLLIDAGADVLAKDCKAFRRAINGGRAGRVHVIRMLLENGCDIGNNRANALMMQAVRKNCIEDLNTAIADGGEVNFEQGSALYHCAARGFTPLVQKLIDSNADVNINQSKAIRVAAKGGYTDAVSALLKAGADANSNEGGALRVACSEGYIDIVKLLMQYDIVDEYQRTALDRAKEWGHLDVIAEFKDLPSFVTA